MFPFIQKLATGKNILILFFLFLLFVLGVMPFASEKLESVAGEVSPLDLMIPTYSPEEAFGILERMGENGREMYRFIEISLDVAYPLIYGFAFSLLIAYAWKPFPFLSRLMLVVPLLAMVLDFGENFFIVRLIDQYPENSIGTAITAGYFSLFKWIFLFMSFALVLVSLIKILVQRLKN